MFIINTNRVNTELYVFSQSMSKQYRDQIPESILAKMFRLVFPSHISCKLYLLAEVPTIDALRNVTCLL